MPITISGRTYDCKDGKFLLAGDDVKQAPDILYKYYAVNDMSVSTLTDMYVYATHPMQFSDKNDCNKDIVRVDDVKDSLCIVEKEDIIKRIRECYGDEAVVSFADEAYYELMYRKMGVLSLCDTYDNEYLWDEFAKDDGFCVAFDYRQWPFYTNVYPVGYVDVIPKLRTCKNDFPTALFVQCMVKLEIFRKEGEWRMLIHSPEGEDMESFGKYRNLPMCHYHNRHFYYPYESVKCIILGHQFFGDTIRKINDNEYRVKFEHESAATKILDFIINVQYDVFWRNVGDLGRYEYLHIFILHLHDYSYRIFVDNETNENENNV